MKSYSIILLVLLLPSQRWLATVSGHIRDHDGKPLAGAQITYTNVGQYTNGGAMDDGDAIKSSMQGRSQINNTGNGRVYKTKTDKKGEFVILGMMFGVYDIEITDAEGKRVYSVKRLVGDNTDKDISNVLNVDLSTAPPPGEPTPTGKMTKEQAALARHESGNSAKINRLNIDLRPALAAHDWDQATNLLQQLIALDPDRWEFYQNLGTIQSNTGKYQEAAQNFQKGIELARKGLENASDSAKLKTDISSMMISEGDALHRLDKLDDAMELYKQAAELAPQPAMAYFQACNAQSNRGTREVAIDLCSKAIAADPNQWEFYQVLAGDQSASGKSDDAIETYEKGAEVARKELAAKPDSALVKNGLGQMLNAEGNIYAQQSKYDLAIAAFAESAKNSAYAALPYFNLCATYYNEKRLDETVTACDQAIASDPTMSEAYYIKAAALFGKGKLAGGKYAPPEEARASLNKYLEFAPFGQHAQLVREMIDKLNEANDAKSPTAKPAKK